METIEIKRRLSIGAEIQQNGGVHFRVWAPKRKTVEIFLENPTSPSQYSLQSEENGYFSGFIEEAGKDTLYRFKLDQKDYLYPDPASRYQPKGPHGPSQVIDPSQYNWKDQDWKGMPTLGRVIYEMHIGTFTQQGTLQSAKQELLELADLGINIIEMMPVNEFPGNFGWGYDGVNLFAPTHLYGHPDDLREFIDHAHSLGMGVVLDVIYNHFGPDGCYVGAFSDYYFTSNHVTEWGDAINFDGKFSKPVREFFLSNAGYWIDEFHFDGLRVDATQNIYDDSEPHILSEIATQVRKMARGKETYLIAESENQIGKLIQPIEQGGYGLDAVWNDDFHHSAIVRLTGRSEAYYIDYKGTPQEFISALKYGYLYQGQWYKFKNKRRGTTTLHHNPIQFINFIQNHDQIANSAHGLRIQQLTDPGNYRAITALLLLAPSTPMLFQGQEFAASTPFYYFADHHEELSYLVFKGRREYFKIFSTISTPEIDACLPHPAELEIFNKCKLNFAERYQNEKAYFLHKDLLKLRKFDPIFSLPRTYGLDGSILSDDAFLLRFFGENEKDTRLFMINFGVDLSLSPAPDPLLAPPEGTSWELLWSSEHPRYGGGGTPPLNTDHTWILLGHSAIVLIPKSNSN